MARPLTKRWVRANGWLTAVLLFVVAVQVNRLAQRFIHERRDFSEDQLYAVSPATRAILGRLDDQLSLSAYITDRLELGDLALLQARVRTQLSELSALGGERVRLTEVDPSIDSTALGAAQTFGMRPYQDGQSSGTRFSASAAYMGLVLRYRGREEVLAQMNPWSLEAEFAGAVRRLLTNRRLVVGWLGDRPVDNAAYTNQVGSFEVAKARLGSRYEVQALEAARLEAGSPVPEQVEAIVVVRPDRLHPRAVFALDQFVQRGGRLLLCVDWVRIPLGGLAQHEAQGKAPNLSGLEALLSSWGAPIGAYHVWDVERAGEVGRAIKPPAGSGEQYRLRRLADPACPVLPPGSGESIWPPTSVMGALQLYWAQAIQEAEAPAGLRRLNVLHTSERTWPTDGPLGRAVTSVGDIESLSTSLAHDPSLRQARTLACVLEGRFPSPFTRGAPAPFDATTDERGGPIETTDEPVLSAAEESAVVVIGDSDWLRDPAPGDQRLLMPGLVESHARFLDDTVDWLLRDDELIAVRAKKPRSRPLHDFDAEALAEVGLDGLVDNAHGREEQLARDRNRATALRKARIRRLRAMLLPPGLVLALMALFALGGSLWMRREA